MKQPTLLRQSTATLAVFVLAGGLFILIGCAIYILAQGNAAQPSSRPNPRQTPVQQPTPRINFKTTAIPGQSLARSTFTAPQAVPPVENQQTEAFDEIIAEVNNVPLSKQMLQIVLDADHAIGLLLNTTVAVDRTVALERLVNGELVRQAAQPAGFRLEEAAISQSLQVFLTANQKNDTDLAQALTRVHLTRTEFVEYFGRLLLIDRFVRKEAAQLHVADTLYLQQLQQAAHISFGPAAATILADAILVDAKDTQPISNAITTGVTSETLAARDAISFTLPVLNASSRPTLTLQSLLGHPTVLSFWTTWCPYCKRQTPLLVAAHAQYAQQGIQFVGIDVKDAQASVQAYITANQILYPVPLDADGRVANAYNVHGFPTTLFLDAQGHVVARQIGALTAEKLTEYIQQLLQNAN